MVEIPDEYGLSSDSLRGSHQFIQPHLVDADDSRDPLTGRPNPRARLSVNEIRALQDRGMLVDENGYEREPEPIVVAAPYPLAQPRVRRQDAAPAGETRPSPAIQIPVDSPLSVADGDRDRADEQIRRDRERAATQITPYGGMTPATPDASNPPPSETTESV